MSKRGAVRPSPPSVDVVLLTPHGRRLAVLLRRTDDGKSREKWELPWTSFTGTEALDDVARSIARGSIGGSPAWLDQALSYGDRRRHPSESVLSIAYLGLIAAGTPQPVGGDYAWFPTEQPPSLAPRQRAMLEDALLTLPARLEQAPIAFHLLPSTFTLTQLQEIYELLLGRRIHKASFRRALHAAWLVEPIDEWRSEGRGRPAQLFRYAPKKRRGSRRGVRFEGLEG